MDRNTGAIKKSILRNVEVPQKALETRRKVNYAFPSAIASEAPCPATKPWRDHQILPATTSRLAKANLFEHGLKYKVPQLNSSEQVARKIERIGKAKVIKSDDVMGDLTPRSRVLVKKEITKKLNFHPDKPVYKNLIPINVNDSILIPSEERKQPFRKKYLAKSNKDPIPELSDFLTPIPPYKHVVPLYNKPPILLKPNNSFYKDAYELHVNFHPDC